MSDKAIFGFTVDDVGYDGFSTPEHLKKVLDFCDELEIKVTFFTVPISEGKRLDQSPGYVALLKEAISKGHEVAQHGLSHDRFEMGIPPQMVLDLPHEKATKKYLEDNREEIEESHSVENIRQVLTEGRGIVEAAIGQDIRGFRAPALQTSDNLFLALEAEGYLYDSSIYLQPAAWDIINGFDYVPKKINQGIYDQAQRMSTTRELATTAEYTWYLEQEKFPQCFDLALHDFSSCAEAGIPFVNISHVSPIQEGENNQGFDFYRLFIGEIEEKYQIEFLTLTQVAEKEKEVNVLSDRSV